eukprot:353245-Chlamydomonas_euryale.AAC.4
MGGHRRLPRWQTRPATSVRVACRVSELGLPHQRVWPAASARVACHSTHGLQCQHALPAAPAPTACHTHSLPHRHARPVEPAHAATILTGGARMPADEGAGSAPNPEPTSKQLAAEPLQKSAPFRPNAASAAMPDKLVAMLSAAAHGGRGGSSSGGGDGDAAGGSGAAASGGVVQLSGNKPPLVIYASRTHSQLAQVMRVGVSCALRIWLAHIVKMGVLAGSGFG